MLVGYEILFGTTRLPKGDLGFGSGSTWKNKDKACTVLVSLSCVDGLLCGDIVAGVSASLAFTLELSAASIPGGECFCFLLARGKSTKQRLTCRIF